MKTALLMLAIVSLSSAQDIEVLPVQGNVYLLAGAGANITLQVGKSGVLMVDTATAPMSAARASVASPGACRRGNSKLMGRSRRGGNIRSRHKRIAVLSPASAISTAFRVSASASPSSSISATTVAL